MTAVPGRAGSAGQRDRGTYGGMLAVAVAAAVLSFSALTGLAELAGVTAALPLPAGGRFRLAWLLPIAVDAYAVTATRVWLRTAGTARTRGYARRNAIGAIGLSVAGNAVYHALDAAGVASLVDVRAGWVVVVAVSAVPPVMLGLVGHLHALVSDDYQTAPSGTGRLVVAVDELGEFLATGTPPPLPPGAVVQPARTGPAAGGRTGMPRPLRTGTRAGARTGSRRTARTGRTDAELTAALAGLPREPDGTVPIRRATAALGCGPDRARRLLAAAGLLRTPTTPTTTAPPAELTPAHSATDTAATDPDRANTPAAA
jgi:hypothetical protein